MSVHHLKDCVRTFIDMGTIMISLYYSGRIGGVDMESVESGTDVLDWSNVLFPRSVCLNMVLELPGKFAYLCKPCACV